MATAAQKHQVFQNDYMTLTVDWDDRMAGRVPDQVTTAMTALSSELLERSKGRAPRRSGRLVNDTGVTVNSAQTEWRIQYRAPYARRQHFAHPTGGRPGPGRRTVRLRTPSSIPSKKLWLMTTVREEMDDLARDIAARVRL